MNVNDFAMGMVFMSVVFTVARISWHLQCDDFLDKLVGKRKSIYDDEGEKK
jgi:hypothetical protein